MLTQFYGTVSVDDSRAAISGASTNNFSVDWKSTGHTRLTLNEWVAHAPCVLITPQSPVWVRYEVVNRYTLDVFTATQDGTLVDADYSVALVCGKALSIELPSGRPLEVSARITSFGSDDVSVLVLSIPGVGDLDKGSVLTALTEDDSVEMTLSDSTLQFGGSTYQLSGYTYTTGQSGPSPWPYTVTMPFDTGLSSPLESFRVTATAPDGTVLTSDPLAIIKKKGS